MQNVVLDVNPHDQLLKRALQGVIDSLMLDFAAGPRKSWQRTLLGKMMLWVESRAPRLSPTPTGPGRTSVC